jgi:glutamyl-tRNA reductase
VRLIASATAALAAVAILAPSASADHYEGTIDDIKDAVAVSQPYHPCLTDITIPDCVNWVLDESLYTVQELRRIYNEEIQARIDPQYCKVHYILDGTPCPDRTPNL